MHNKVQPSCPVVEIPKSTNWLLIVQKHGCDFRLKSIPEEPTFYKDQTVYLTFSNQTNEPLVIGIIALGLETSDGDEKEGITEVDLGKEYQWIDGGLRTSGIVPVSPEFSKTVKFRIPTTVNNKDTPKPYFAYEAFIVGPSAGALVDDSVSIENKGASLVQLFSLDNERAIDPIVHIPPVAS